MHFSTGSACFKRSATNWFAHCSFVNVCPSFNSGPVWPGLKGPLKLSYTAIDQYQRCPRCFYLRQVLDLNAPPGPKQILGQAVHGALESFYKQVQLAESEGHESPGRARLIELGRAAFFRNWPRQSEIDRAQLDQVLAQLGVAFDRLIAPATGGNVVEVEKRAEFPYGAHTFDGKIDRIDQYTGADGVQAFRIVDYKTGNVRNALTEPEPDDLQLGIYALALAHMYELGDPREQPLAGVAEYWVLRTGERGEIPLSAIDFGAIHATIDGAIAGMLAGKWERGKGCKKDCDMLGSLSMGVHTNEPD